MLGGVNHDKNQISYMPGGWPTNWKIIIPPRISHRKESSEPRIRLPNLEVWWQEEALREYDFEDKWGFWAQ